MQQITGKQIKDGALNVEHLSDELLQQLEEAMSKRVHIEIKIKEEDNKYIISPEEIGNGILVVNNSVEVFLNGLLQLPETHYTYLYNSDNYLTGITFIKGLEVNDVVVIRCSKLR